jgi:predicted ATPase
MLSRLAISGYRSIRDIVVGLDRLNVIVGANGAGKSSLYRSLRLLAEIAQGSAVASLAAEGGLNSILWAGPEALSRAMKDGSVPVQGTVRRSPFALKLGFGGEDFGFAAEIGYFNDGATMFGLDPHIKAETMWTGDWAGRANIFAERRGPLVKLRDRKGAWRNMRTDLSSGDSMMASVDPDDGLELLALRERMRNWRFYDHLRTDRDAPARHPRIGTRTPVLANDGGDLAAALQTIREIGDSSALDATISDAFQGARIDILDSDGRFDVEMRQHGLLRPLRAAELSDGTLRYLMLAAALLSPRAPPLMVLNEPETSLHPQLLEPLARLIANVRGTQIIVVTHAQSLADAITAARPCNMIKLEKELGETVIPDQDRPTWHWPAR